MAMVFGSRGFVPHLVWLDIRGNTAQSEGSDRQIGPGCLCKSALRTEANNRAGSGNGSTSAAPGIHQVYRSLRSFSLGRAVGGDEESMP